MFQGAKRDVETLWENCIGPRVVLWDSLEETEKATGWLELNQMEDWSVWKKPPSTKEEMQDDAKVKVIGECTFQGEKETGTAVKVKGWWQRGDIQTTASKTEMQSWIHKKEK
jgi:hypothetical protein